VTTTWWNAVVILPVVPKILQLVVPSEILTKIWLFSWTITGTETYVPGQKAFAFDFDGSSSITLANENNFDFERTDEFSVAFWMKGDATSTDALISKKSSFAIGDSGWVIVQENNHILVRISDGTTNFNIFGTTGSITTAFHHVVVTYSGNSNVNGFKIYIDGSLDTTGPAQTIAGTLINDKFLTFGAFSNADFKYNGFLDDILIFNFELTPSEIAILS